MSKKTAHTQVWMSDELELALRRLAEEDGRKFSAYCAIVLRRHVRNVLGPDALEQEEPSIRSESEIGNVFRPLSIDRLKQG